jgi:hypothetical protein
MMPSRRTIGRWRHWIEGEFDLHSLHLRGRSAQLGRAVDWKALWSLCLQTMSLSQAMDWLDRMGVRVP